MLNFSVIAALVVLSCWILFPFIFVFFSRRAAPGSAPERTRDVRSRFGLALQGLSYAFAWGLPRLLRPLVGFSPALNTALLGLAMLLAVGSLWLVTTAIRTLGKEWSLTARLVEGHRLVATGPYRFVRHPIYTGMFGMLLATALSWSHWLGLVLSLIIFWSGTIVRVRSEERLLRAAFGAEFEAYARRVPAVVPGWY
jgi:protein-S-isoprenylcysteine O-methyltransferase Ste14